MNIWQRIEKASSTQFDDLMRVGRKLVPIIWERVILQRRKDGPDFSLSSLSPIEKEFVQACYLASLGNTRVLLAFQKRLEVARKASHEVELRKGKGAVVEDGDTVIFD